MTGQRVHRTMEMIPALPRPPCWSKSPSVSFPIKRSTKKNKGTQGVQARYDAELPPFISIVQHTGRPVMLGMEPRSPKRVAKESKRPFPDSFRSLGVHWVPRKLFSDSFGVGGEEAKGPGRLCAGGRGDCKHGYPKKQRDGDHQQVGD